MPWNGGTQFNLGKERSAGDIDSENKRNWNSQQRDVFVCVWVCASVVCEGVWYVCVVHVCGMFLWVCVVWYVYVTCVCVYMCGAGRGWGFTLLR